MMYLTDDEVRPGNGIGLMIGLIIINEVLAENGCNCGLYSLNDRKHSRTSLHYADQAIDIRTKDFPSMLDPHEIVREIKSRLNKHYDVIYEGNHIHIEFQPRGF